MKIVVEYQNRIVYLVGIDLMLSFVVIKYKTSMLEYEFRSCDEASTRRSLHMH